MRFLGVAMVAAVVVATVVQGVQAIAALLRAGQDGRPTRRSARALPDNDRGGALLLATVFLSFMLIPLLLIMIELPAQTSAYIWGQRTTRSAAQRIAWMCQDSDRWRTGGSLQLRQACIKDELDAAARVLTEHHAVADVAWTPPVLTALKVGADGCKQPVAGSGHNVDCLAVELEGAVEFESLLGPAGVRSVNLATAARSVARVLSGQSGPGP